MMQSEAPEMNHVRQYLIILLLVSRHIIIHIAACAFNGQDAIPDGRNHVELLDNGVHVASRTCIFQTHKPLGRPWANWRQKFPFCKWFTT